MRGRYNQFDVRLSDFATLDYAFTGEDATEVANPPNTCTQDCQAQNQVKGPSVEPRLPVPGARRQQADAAGLGPGVAAADRALTVDGGG